MDDHLQKFLAAQHAFADRVHAVTEDQWQASTPATDWTVADLVAHLVDEHRVAAPIVHGQDPDAAQKIADGSRELPVDGGVGSNLAEAWDEASSASADAFAEDGALDRSVTLSRGSTPARDYISEMIFDLTVHAWDLQQAIGFDGDLPSDVVEAVYADAQSMGDLSSSGLFGEAVDVPDDASTIDKLVALTGRSPQ